MNNIYFKSSGASRLHYNNEDINSDYLSWSKVLFNRREILFYCFFSKYQK